MPARLIPGTALEYFLVSYDRHGVELADPDEPSTAPLLSDRIVARARDDTPAVTDIFVFSHGWHGDVPAAVRQYDSWVPTMAACEADLSLARLTRPGFQPLLVGIHWPSEPWGDERLSSSAPGRAFGASVSDQEQLAPMDLIDKEVDTWAARIDPSPAARDALRTLITSWLEDVAPERLPVNVVDAYGALDAALALGAKGAAGLPGSDRDPWDAQRTYEALLNADISGGAPYSGGLADGLLAPLRVLSFWAMKRRACVVGENGVADLVARLASLSGNTRGAPRVHLIGHSFGCIVTSAAVAKLPPRHSVYSLVLVQGALSLWSFCADIPSAPGSAGYFRRVLEDDRVTGAIATTTSTNDRAVGLFYPIGAGLAGQVAYGTQLPKFGACGALGARGGREFHVADLDILPATDPYVFSAGVVFNIEASRIIADGNGPAGAHNDIAHAEVAHIVWSAALM